MSDDDIRPPEEARIQKLEERMNDMIHVAELRELVDQWREEQRRSEQDPDAHQAQGMALGRCAGELEELINE